MSTSFPINGMRVRFAGATDVGQKRSHNEDSIYLPDKERLVVVADGMGGHASGDVASKLAVDTMAQFYRDTSESPEVTCPFMVNRDGRHEQNRLVTSVKLANLKISELAQSDSRLKGMGTTVVAVFFADEEVLIAHVGDSRVYLMSGGELSQVTTDHSLLNDYIKIKRIDPNDVESFPHKNVIVRALGMKDQVLVDLLKREPCIGDVYLLCSDGLCDMVEDPAIAEVVRAEQNLDDCCVRLVELANKNGGADNISVALARVEPA